jgi:hypothetical protein
MLSTAAKVGSSLNSADMLLESNLEAHLRVLSKSLMSLVGSLLGCRLGDPSGAVEMDTAEVARTIGPAGWAPLQRHVFEEATLFEPLIGTLIASFFWPDKASLDKAYEIVAFRLLPTAVLSRFDIPAYVVQLRELIASRILRGALEGMNSLQSREHKDIALRTVHEVCFSLRPLSDTTETVLKQHCASKGLNFIHIQRQLDSARQAGEADDPKRLHYMALRHGLGGAW